MYKPLTTTISILGLAFVLVGCKGGGGGGEAMATINGETISKDEYVSHLERKVQVLVNVTPDASTPGPHQLQVAQPLNFQALNDLVNQRLLLQMAKKENVLPSDSDVAAEVKYQTSKRPDFVSSLTSQGLTLNDINGELLVSLARHNLLTKGITISDAAVMDYIKENPKQFENPELVDITWIVLKDGTNKAKVDADLKSGQTFAIVAKNFTVAPSGPMYPSRELQKFPDRMKALVAKLPENGTSEWEKDGTSWVKIHVEKKTPSSKVELKDWMKTEIRRMLSEQKGSAAMDLDKRLLNDRKAAAIVITKTGLKERFDELSKKLKESDVKDAANSRSGGSASGAESNNAPAK